MHVKFTIYAMCYTIPYTNTYTIYYNNEIVPIFFTDIVAGQSVLYVYIVHIFRQ